MHPAIHIIAFLIFTLSISLGEYQQLLLGVLVLITGFIIVKPENSTRLLTTLARMKWFWLSLLLVYLWFTPGEPLFDGVAWSPSVDGVIQGLMRIGILIAIVIAAYLLVEKLNREQLVVGLNWLITPLTSVGVSTERFALRMMLVIETVPKIQGLYIEHQANMDVANKKNPLSGIGNNIARVFVSVIERAETDPCDYLEIPDYEQVSLKQFLYPILLATGFWIISYF